MLFKGVMQQEFKFNFARILQPTLTHAGFHRVELTSCIHYEELWRKERLWFGASFDWRDQYLEISLGHLYWFHDAMPRVIVLGDYRSYCNFDPYAKALKDGVVNTLNAIRDSFDHALEVYESHYNDMLQGRLRPKNLKYAKEFLGGLGEEVKEQELENFYA